MFHDLVPGDAVKGAPEDDVLPSGKIVMESHAQFQDACDLPFDLYSPLIGFEDA